ncbi:carboxylesterase [Dactylonectria estremocensis]|uniref:Carboxylic ester hydrolase n=1 Tax=Dactylonectria estremocensis TaxID=1079267 RepID=A0A9P9DQK9_9HYPO|nr:carboxylesterase [Dactylonectria estremocensis]
MSLRFIVTTALGAILGGLSVHAKAVPRNAPIVETLNGSYYGYHSPVYNQDIFLGVPFAQPPVKDLRFAPPQSLNTTWSGIRNATELGYSCVGYGEDTEVAAKNYTSEDCLSLNVVRPVGYSNERLPVAVWIHGGGWQFGSSATGWYNVSFIVERSVQVQQPIIAIGINYRLAGWGWLHSGEVLEEGSTNVGFRDQRLALHWIKENIAAFGGDPSRITIFGESAGALSVAGHLLAYNGRDDGLFHAAIGQSGPPVGVGPWQPSIEKLSLATANITETVCPNATNKLACLRAADFETLNNAINATLSLPLAGPIYGPIVDGDIVARPCYHQLRDGDFVKVPYLLGTNNDEGGYYGPIGVNDEEGVHNALTSHAIGVNFTQATAIMSHYPYSGIELDIPGLTNAELNTTIGLQFKRVNTMTTDIVFKAPSRYAAQLWQKHSPNLYIYNANTTLPVGPNYYGSAHGYELPYMFYNLNGSGWEGNSPPFLGGNPFAGRPQPYLDLAAVMSGLWVGFMNTGVPHYENQPVPEWPVYQDSNPSIMIFDAQPGYLNTRVGKEERTEEQDFVISQLYL